MKPECRDPLTTPAIRFHPTFSLKQLSLTIILHFCSLRLFPPHNDSVGLPVAPRRALRIACCFFGLFPKQRVKRHEGRISNRNRTAQILQEKIDNEGEHVLFFALVINYTHPVHLKKSRETFGYAQCRTRLIGEWDGIIMTTKNAINKKWINDPSDSCFKHIAG